MSDIEDVEEQVEFRGPEDSDDHMAAEVCCSRKSYGGLFKGNHRLMVTYIQNLRKWGQVKVDMDFMKRRLNEFKIDFSIDTDEFEEFKLRNSFLEKELDSTQRGGT